MKSLSLKQRAISLRRGGYSYSYIASITKISKSTLSGWLHEVQYIPNKFTINTIGNARAKSAESKALSKQKSYQTAFASAKSDIGDISSRDLFMLGVGLYIGEGSKTNDIIRIVNSDPRIIRLAIKWFTEVCGLSVKNLVARIHIYPTSNAAKASDFWYRKTGIPRENFYTPYIDKRSNKKVSRAGSTPHGTIHITVRANGNRDFGVALSRRIAGWMDLVLECGLEKRG
jgi:hypothetical protein